MPILVIAEHDNAGLKAATLNTVSAAARLGADIEVLVAGSDTRVPTPREPTTTAATSAHVVKRRPRTLPRGTPFRARTDPFLEAQPTAALSPPLSIRGVRKLIASRASLLGKGVDHFEFLGVSYDASIAEVRAAYVELARYLRRSASPSSATRTSTTTREPCSLRY